MAGIRYRRNYCPAAPDLHRTSLCAKADEAHSSKALNQLRPLLAGVRGSSLFVANACSSNNRNNGFTSSIVAERSGRRNENSERRSSEIVLRIEIERRPACSLWGLGQSPPGRRASLMPAWLSKQQPRALPAVRTTRATHDAWQNVAPQSRSQGGNRRHGGDRRFEDEQVLFAEWRLGPSRNRCRSASWTWLS